MLVIGLIRLSSTGRVGESDSVSLGMVYPILSISSL